MSWFEHFIAVDCCNELLVILNFHHKSSLMSEINTETQKPKNNTFQPRDDIWLDWICVLNFGSMFTLNIPESTFNLMHTMSILCQQYEYKSWFNNVCYVWVCSANTVQSLTNKQKNLDSFQMGSWLQLIVHFIHKLIELSMTIFGGCGKSFYWWRISIIYELSNLMLILIIFALLSFDRCSRT